MSRDPNLRYLQKLGHSYYVRVKVPPKLQPIVGNTHIRKALNTRDLNTAIKLKWKYLEAIKAYLNRLQEIDPLNLEAQEFREAIRKATDKENYEGVNVLSVVATDRAEDLYNKLKDKVGEGAALERAKEWCELATTTEHTLDELIEEWLSHGSDYSKQTKKQHRSVYKEFKCFIGGDTLPTKVTEEVALTYVEEVIKKSGQAYNTQRRKITALSTFWGYMASKKYVPRDVNPWKGFKLSKRKTLKQTKDKRPYTEKELIKLFSVKPRYKGLSDVMVLGLYTGARIEEICSLRQQDIRSNGDGIYFISIRKAKTEAGIRTIAVTHPLPSTVLKKRWNNGNKGNIKNNNDEQLFPEFKGGGYDDKLSHAVSKAFGRYKKALGFDRATDFHSFRRTLITLMENLEIHPVRIARYVGHEFDTLAAKIYSGGSSEKTNVEVARSIHYSEEVEEAVNLFLINNSNT